MSKGRKVAKVAVPNPLARDSNQKVPRSLEVEMPPIQA